MLDILEIANQKSIFYQGICIMQICKLRVGFNLRCIKTALDPDAGINSLTDHHLSDLYLD